MLGSPRFKRTHKFDDLRTYVRRTFPNLRVIVLIRSEPIGGHPMPQIQLTGMWVQVEDKVARTVRPPRKVSIPRRYVRPLTTDKLGRIVGSWDEARDGSRIEAAHYVKIVGDIARQLLREAAR